MKLGGQVGDPLVPAPWSLVSVPDRGSNPVGPLEHARHIDRIRDQIPKFVLGFSLGELPARGRSPQSLALESGLGQPTGVRNSAAPGASRPRASPSATRNTGVRRCEKIEFRPVIHNVNR